ncbi:epithelial membrane protein 3-like isoform X2 [Mercenaria mercenaria]|uniref:epithelial membrane protein 3-like isoform X2 n=1 Tax=Mercenaria mercenaria TaxID=6596 RepID=UPI00234F21C7|nr:epithelial membrane protein 3-like isoform X2 [Mercenaria mercenaria]
MEYFRGKIHINARLKMNNTLLIALVLTCVALLLCIISTAIPYWWSSDNFDLGLFRYCGTINILGTSSTSCGEFSDVPDWMKATRAMMVLSILALGASILLSVLFGFIMKEKQFLAILAAFMCFAAAGLAILGVIIYGAKAPLKSFDLVYGEGSLHAGFGLAIIAAIAAVVAGVFVFLSKGRNV